MKIYIGFCLILWVSLSQIVLADDASLSDGSVDIQELNPTNSTISNHLQTPSNKLPIKNIVLIGTDKQKRSLTRWLNDIAVIPKGAQTLKMIEKSGHTLTIKHSEAARLSSGRTIAPMTQKLTNGIGDDITIIFDADMDDRGTHRVFGVANELVEFNAQQNLFHELAHAMHMMKGTWRYFASEKQAIEEENEFRIGFAKVNGEKPRLRYLSRGVLITNINAGGIGYQLNQ